MDAGLVVGVIALGVVHGVLPDHGWPIAATYALAQPRKWVSGTVAALVLGIGHLISSIALVVAYYGFSTFAEFAEGPWMKPLAGGLLILLGIYEYFFGGHGHDHGHEGEHDHHGDEHDHGEDHHHDHHHGDGHEHGHDHHEHDHGHDHDHHHGDDHDHGHDHDHHHGDDHDHGHGHDHGHTHHEHGEGGILARIRERLFGGGHQHLTEEHAEGGLRTLGMTALVLGFAHEEPIQILALCAGADGPDRCLELMLVYSLAVIIAILLPTLVLIAGYQTYRERIERYTPYLPTVTAAVLIAVGLWFLVEGVLPDVPHVHVF